MLQFKRLLIVLLGLALLASFLVGFTPLIFSLLIVFSSVMTYAAYAKDKKAAINNEWRVPEKTLHLMSVFFGWPGAVIAQERLRHKTQKTSFVVMFWVTVSINIGVIYALHTPDGFKYINQMVGYGSDLIISQLTAPATKAVWLGLIELRQ